MKSLKYNLIILLCAFIWGYGFVGMKVAMFDIGPFWFIFLRMIIGTIVLIPCYFISEKLYNKRDLAAGIVLTDQEKQAKVRFMFKSGALTGLMAFLGAAFQQMGLVTTTAGKSGFITALYTILIPLIGLVFGKKIKLLGWVAVLLGITGLFLICIKEDLSLTIGDGLTLVSAFWWACEISLVGHFAPKVNPIGFTGVITFVCCIGGIICALIFETISMEATMAAMPSILFVGIFVTGIAYALQAIGQQGANSTISGLILSTEAVFGAIFGVIVLNETMTPKEVIGCVIVFIAIVIAQFSDMEKKDIN